MPNINNNESIGSFKCEMLDSPNYCEFADWILNTQSYSNDIAIGLMRNISDDKRQAITAFIKQR